MRDALPLSSSLTAHREQVELHLHDLPHAPSVQVQSVPRQSVAQATGIDTGLEEPEASLDMDSHIKHFVERARNRRQQRHSQAAVLSALEDTAHSHPRPSRSLLNGNGRGHGSSLQNLIDTKLSTARREEGRRFFGYVDPPPAGGDTDVDDEEDVDDGDDLMDDEDGFSARPRAAPLWESFGQGNIVVAAA